MFAERFRELLDEAGKTQSDVAGALGVSAPYVSSIAAGRELPSPERCRQIAQAIGVDPSELLAVEAVERGRVELPDLDGQARLALALELVRQAEAARR